MESSDETKALVKEQFGRTAENFVKSPTHATGEDLALIVEWLQPEPGWLVLDVATGGGHVAKTLSPHVRSVWAGDLTPAMLRAARKHLTASGCDNVGYICVDAEAMPFIEDSFDAVTCRIAAHHFPHPERFVVEVARVLKPHGKFVLIDNVAPERADLADYLNRCERIRDESHARCVPVSEWTAWLSANGLRTVNSLAAAKTHEFQPWVRRMARDEEQVQRVEDFLLAAPDDARRQFDIRVVDGRVTALTVNQLMIVCEKAG